MRVENQGVDKEEAGSAREKKGGGAPLIPDHVGLDINVITRIKHPLTVITTHGKENIAYEEANRPNKIVLLCILHGYLKKKIEWEISGLTDLVDTK